MARTKWTQDEIKQFLRTNDQVLYKALKDLYACQMADEQRLEGSIHHNRMGFAKPDAKSLTIMAKLLNEQGVLSFENTQKVRDKLVGRYTKQITKIFNAQWAASEV